MKLSQLIGSIPTIQLSGDLDIEVSGLCLDSRQVKEGNVYFAKKGSLVDGHDFIDSAILLGAKIIILENWPVDFKPQVTYVQVTAIDSILGTVASNYNNHPSKYLKIIGTTGTNGKTTISTLLYQLFMDMGYDCGLISTVENRILDELIPATHTTPDPITLQALLSEMVRSEVEYVFMEVSSHAVHQERIQGIHFVGGVFSNITHDHLDYHGTFDEYIKVKKSFFDHLPASAFALTNLDDKRGAVMLQNTKAKKATYALKSLADFKAKILENNLDGLLLLIDQQEVHFRLSGLFNAYNILAVYGVATLCGLNKLGALAHLSNLKGAAGRFETYRSKQEKILGIVDYAHTPDALLNVLATIKMFGGVREVITVVGCGGDRDKTKRPLMAQVACEHSHKVILTSDNPRTEDPEVILDEMESGLTIAQKRKTIRVANRKEAIKLACSMAQAEDVILIAGKGHENYQEINKVKHHFDDKEVLLNMFELYNK